MFDRNKDGENGGRVDSQAHAGMVSLSEVREEGF